MTHSSKCYGAYFITCYEIKSGSCEKNENTNAYGIIKDLILQGKTDLGKLLPISSIAERPDRICTEIFEALNVTATVMIVCTHGKNLFMGVHVGVTKKASGLLLGVPSNQYVILFMIYFILFIGGVLLDGVFMCILTPLMKLFHWDPVLFGVMTAPFLAPWSLHRFSVHHSRPAPLPGVDGLTGFGSINHISGGVHMKLLEMNMKDFQAEFNEPKTVIIPAGACEVWGSHSPSARTPSWLRRLPTGWPSAWAGSSGRPCRLEIPRWCGGQERSR